MWWLPLYGRAPSFAAAQQFHFDMDRWKWLNWFLYLTDGATFMIFSGGVNIYPREIEDVLVMHPLVDDVAVIGVPDPDMGEAVKAIVQLVPGTAGAPDLADELIAFARERLTHYKCPKSVDFDPQLPRLPTGKLYKRVLRDRYWDDRINRLA